MGRLEGSDALGQLCLCQSFIDARAQVVRLRTALDRLGEFNVPYIEVSSDQGTARITQPPMMEHIPVGGIDVQQTVSYYSRL